MGRDGDVTPKRRLQDGGVRFFFGAPTLGRARAHTHTHSRAHTRKRTHASAPLLPPPLAAKRCGGGRARGRERGRDEYVTGEVTESATGTYGARRISRGTRLLPLSRPPVTSPCHVLSRVTGHEGDRDVRDRARPGQGRDRDAAEAATGCDGDVMGTVAAKPPA